MFNHLKIEEIKALLDYQKLLVDNVRKVNCYAYSLGLDIPEEKINNKAYSVIGTIARCYGDYSLFDTLFSPLTERLEMDLKTLGLEYMEVGPNEHLQSEEWKIALMLNEYNEFHFAKQIDKNTWWHKYGYYFQASNKDDNGNVIYNIAECSLGGSELYRYKLKKCYSLKRRQ